MNQGYCYTSLLNSGDWMYIQEREGYCYTFLLNSGDKIVYSRTPRLLLYVLVEFWRLYVCKTEFKNPKIMAALLFYKHFIKVNVIYPWSTRVNTY